MNARRINLWGGPGVGKSTCAATVYMKMKVSLQSVEIVPEYVKSWAYDGKVVQSFDQLYVFAKQLRLEYRCLSAGVDRIISDSPLLMQSVYARRAGFVGTDDLISIAKKFENVYPSYNILLNRKCGEYVKQGRYQTHEEALQVDIEMERFLHEHEVSFEKMDNNPEDVANRVLELTYAKLR